MPEWREDQNAIMAREAKWLVGKRIRIIEEEAEMSNLLEIIKERRSVRTFDGRPLADEDRAEIEAYIGTLDELFDIPVEYVFIEGGKDGRESQVLVGDKTFIAGKVPKVPYAEVAFGYSFEKVILYAWSMGIGTVWIGGTMKREAFEKAAGLKDSEVMPCITPLGYEADKMSMREKLMRKTIKADSRKPADKLFFDRRFGKPLKANENGEVSDEKIGEFTDLFEMVRWAPSAVNKQPWRIVADDGVFHFYEKQDRGYMSEATGDLQKIDIGIALCHFTMGLDEKDMTYMIEVNDPGIGAPEDIHYIASVRLVV